MPRHTWIEYPLLVVAVCSPFLIIVLRLLVKEKTTARDGTTTEAPRGIGVRMIQLVAVLILVPTIAVLALQGVLSAEGTGTLMGAIVGYALGGITSDGLVQTA
jgi:hypothetical protein